ncbi:MAG: chemotaxis protein CheW [Proteobacteria bacterium]|nr:chemotaxis protein CheW [Pseudomonadota bacterium]
MAAVFDSPPLSPFDALADYERRSLAHVAGMPEQIEAPGLWRGIGFRIGQRYLVSGISEVNEILTPPALTIVPGTRGWLLGVANVRGNLVPVIDLKQYLEGERTQVTDASRVLLVRQAGGSVGLLIDEVLGQRSFSEEQRAEAIGEDDERYGRFIGEKYPLGDVHWGQFSMATLVRTPDFVQAAA